MQRDPKTLEKRRAYVAKFVNEYDGLIKEAIHELSEQLFISKSTIDSDLRKHRDEKA